MCGAGLIAGVLTGSGTKQQLLDTGAHVVLPNIGHLEHLLRCLPPYAYEVTPSSTTVVSDESIASIDDVELRNEDKTAASSLVSMKSEDHDSLLAKAKKDQTNNTQIENTDTDMI